MRNSTTRSLYVAAVVVVIVAAGYYMYTQGTEGFQSAGRAKEYLAQIATLKSNMDSELKKIRTTVESEYANLNKNIKNREAKKPYMRTPAEKTRLVELAQEKALYDEVRAKLGSM